MCLFCSALYSTIAPVMKYIVSLAPKRVFSCLCQIYLECIPNEIPRGIYIRYPNQHKPYFSIQLSRTYIIKCQMPCVIQESKPSNSYFGPLPCTSVPISHDHMRKCGFNSKPTAWSKIPDSAFLPWTSRTPKIREPIKVTNILSKLI